MGRSWGPTERLVEEPRRGPLVPRYLTPISINQYVTDDLSVPSRRTVLMVGVVRAAKRQVSGGDLPPSLKSRVTSSTRDRPALGTTRPS